MILLAKEYVYLNKEQLIFCKKKMSKVFILKNVVLAQKISY